MVVAVPATNDTRGLFSKDVIGLMKSSACLLNVGRGAVIDEAALVPA